MGFIDKVKGALQGKAGKAEKAINKAAGVVDNKTGNKHTDKIDKVADKAKDAVNKIDQSDNK